jgi:hypothetical protein
MSIRVRSIGLTGVVAGLAFGASAHGAPVVPGTLPGLEHVHLLAVDTEFFGPVSFGVWRVNDAPSGNVSGIGLDAADEINESGGLYAIAAINANGGVSVMLPDGDAVEGVTEWGDLFQTDIETVKSWLLASDNAQLEDWFAAEIYDAGLASRFGDRVPLIAFASAASNALGSFELETIDTDAPPSHAGNAGIVPAPSALVVMGLGGLTLARRRRR